MTQNCPPRRRAVESVSMLMKSRACHSEIFMVRTWNSSFITCKLFYSFWEVASIILAGSACSTAGMPTWASTEYRCWSYNRCAATALRFGFGDFNREYLSNKLLEFTSVDDAVSITLSSLRHLISNITPGCYLLPAWQSFIPNSHISAYLPQPATSTFLTRRRQGARRWYLWKLPFEILTISGMRVLLAAFVSPL